MLYKGPGDDDPNIFVGGLRYRNRFGGFANYSMPLARLTIEESGIKITPSGKLAIGMPTIELPWESIARAEGVRGMPIMSPGVRVVKVGSTEARFVFWTFDRERLLDALGERGILTKRRGKPVWFGT